MLLQSHAGELELLPALPAEWPSGRVSGLRARGGYTVEMDWAGGGLRRASIRATRTGTCRVRARGAVTGVVSRGVVVPLRRAESGAVEFPVEAGAVYELAAGLRAKP